MNKSISEVMYTKDNHKKLVEAIKRRTANGRYGAFGGSEIVNKNLFKFLRESGLSISESIQYCHSDIEALLDLVITKDAVSKVAVEVEERISDLVIMETDGRKIKYKVLRSYGFTSQESAKFRNYTFDRMIKLIYRRLNDGC